MAEIAGSLLPSPGLCSMDTALKWYVNDRVEYSPSLRYGLHIAQEGNISDVSSTIKDEDGIHYSAMHLRVTVMDLVDRKYLTSIKVVDLHVDILPHRLAVLSFYWIDDSDVMVLYVDGQHLVRLRMQLDHDALLLKIVDYRTHTLLFWYNTVKKMCSSPIVSVEDKKYVVPMAFSSVILIVPFDMTEEQPVTIAFNEGFLESGNWALSREGNIYFPVDPVYAPHVFLNRTRTLCTVVYRLNLSLLNMQEAYYTDVLEVPELLSVVRFYGANAEPIMQFENCGTSHSGCYMLKYKKAELTRAVPTLVEMFNSIPRNIRKPMKSIFLSSSHVPTIYGNSLLIWSSGLSEPSVDGVFKDKTKPEPMNFVVHPGWVDEVCASRNGIISDLEFPMAMFSPSSDRKDRVLACLRHIHERFAHLKT